MIEELANNVSEKLEKLSGQTAFMEFGGFGDFSTSLPLNVAKKTGKTPKRIAESWAKKLKVPGLETRVEGGFLNFFLTKETIIHNLEHILEFKPVKKIAIVEYSSPNIAKPFSVGHLRSTVIGESIRRTLDLLGWKTHGLNFIGDWGTQFGKLLTAYDMWPVDLSKEPIKELLKIYVKFHEEAEKNPELEDTAREWFRKLESGDAAAVEIWKKFRKFSLQEFQKMYELLGTSELQDYSESRFVKGGQEIADELLKNGIAKKDRGAVVVPVDGGPPLILRKTDGTTIYSSRDLASGIERYEKLSPDLMLYVVGNEQKLHFIQLISVLKKMKVEAQIEHISFGLVRLPGGKMSTRKGQVVFLEDVLSEAVNRVKKIMAERDLDNEETAKRVGIGAVKFADLKTNRLRDTVFKWDMLAFEGETGPYVQYSAVRAKRIGEKFGTGKPGLDDATMRLARKLLRFRIAVTESARLFRPDIIANFLLDLTKTFNELYARERFGGVSEREWLAERTHVVLKKGLELLGIETPDIM